MAGYIAVMSAVVMWAVGGLLVRHLSMFGFQAMTITLLRLFSAWVFTTVFMVAARRRLFRVRPRDLLLFAATGLIGPAGSQPLYIWCVTLTTVAVAAVLNYTSPVFVMILSRLFLGERITPVKIGALAITISGLLLVTGVYRTGSPVSGAALATGVGSGFCYGTYMMLLRKSAVGHDPLVIQWWSMLFGLPFVAMYAWPELAIVPRDLPAAAYLTALAIGAGPGFLAFILFTWGLGRVQASRASIVATIEPAAATILGYLVLGEGMGTAQMIGIVAVLTGITLITASGYREEPAQNHAGG
ncbi:MAG: DMT family transporter [Ignavibacteriales bacterium]